MNKNKEVIEKMFKAGILVNEDILEKEMNPHFFEKIESEADLLVLNSDYLDVINKQNKLIDWYEIDSYRYGFEINENDDIYQSHLQEFKKVTLAINNSQSNKQDLSSLEVEINNSNQETSLEINQKTETVIEKEDTILLPEEPTKQISSAITIIISYENTPCKYKVEHFTKVFISRYKFLENLLRNRQELSSILTINRLLAKKEREQVSVIGLVDDIGETRNGNIILTLEDLTGKIKVLISKNRKELLTAAKDLVVDEVIGIKGVSGDKIIFAESIVWPDVPQNNDIKKSPKDEYAIFLSDIHVGSNLFLKEEFNKFIRWIKGEVGNEQQRQIAQKINYIFIAGDLVDGMGIYPNQEEELDIKDISEQYTLFCKLIKEIPSTKQIVVCPGNHDGVHLAEPQTAFYKELSPEIFNIPNLTLVSNPAYVNFGKTENFSGFTVLMYHGYSFDYYVANVESIRNNGGYHRSDLIMKFLLKRRHLAPSFKSTPYFPVHKEDPLLIKIIPDFFITGHIHYSGVANYKGITMISGSCWQAKTSFQEKLGHEPEPARVPIVNLRTREIKILRFG